MAETLPTPPAHEASPSANFMHIITLAFATVGLGAMIWAFIAALGPSANNPTVQPVINLARIAPGHTKIVQFHGNPVFIRHLTPSQITKAATRLNPANNAYVVLSGVAPHSFCLLTPTPSGYTDPCTGTMFTPLGQSASSADHLAIPKHRFLAKFSLQLR